MATSDARIEVTSDASIDALDTFLTLGLHNYAEDPRWSRRERFMPCKRCGGIFKQGFCVSNPACVMSAASGRIRNRDRTKARRRDGQARQARGSEAGEAHSQKEARGDGRRHKRGGRKNKKKASRKRKRQAKADEPLWGSEKPEDEDEEDPEVSQDDQEAGEELDLSTFPPASVNIGSWIPWPAPGPRRPAASLPPPPAALRSSAASSSSQASHVWVVCDLLSDLGSTIVELEPHEGSDYILKHIQGQWLPCKRMPRAEAALFTDAVCERIGCPRGVPMAIPDAEADPASAPTVLLRPRRRSRGRTTAVNRACDRPAVPVRTDAACSSDD